MKPQITESGINIQTFDEVFQSLVDGYKSIYGQDISIDSDDPDGQRIGIEARVQLDLQQLAVQVYNSLDPDFDDGLMRTAKLSGIYLKPPSSSQWDLTVTASRGVTLNKGYTVKDDLDQKWWLTGDVAVATGGNTVTFAAKDVGRVEGVQHSEISPVTIVLGVSSITADVAAVEGRDEETPVQLRQRRERSLQNPSYSVVGALFAKLARLDGVTDLGVYENDQEFQDPDNGLPPKSVWVIVEGGRVADIIETIVKQKTAGAYAVGDVESEYLETFIKPNGDTFTISHKMRFDRPTYVDLHIKLSAKAKSSGDPVDEELIKNRLAERTLSISESIQAGELYDDALRPGDNFVLTDMQISNDGVNFTDEELVPALNERFIISTDNINVDVII